MKNRIHIPSPCTASWEAMEGGDQKRFCNQCNKHVHDLSAMTKPQADKVLETPNVCVRFQPDAEGRVVHTPPPRQARLPRLLALGATLLGASPALAAPAVEPSAPSCDSQTIPEATVDPSLMEWVRQQIEALLAPPEKVISQGEVASVPEQPPMRLGAVAMPPPEPPRPVEPPKPVEIMGKVVRPPPLMGKPVMPLQPIEPPPVEPPPVEPRPRLEPGESVIPEVEEALQQRH